MSSGMFFVILFDSFSPKKKNDLKCTLIDLRMDIIQQSFTVNSRAGKCTLIDVKWT